MDHVTFSRRRLMKMFAAVASYFSCLPQVLASSQPLSDQGPPPGLEGFKGLIVTRSNPQYLDWFWAMTWYRTKPPRYPAMFVQPLNTEDVQLAMRYADQANLRVATRSSGHNISLPPLRQDAITIDMSLFHQVEIDEKEKTAWAGAGIFSQHLNEQLYAKGFSFPSAHTGFVSIGGFLLGGGMGWNMQNWGMACSSVLALDLVLADGTRVVASETENSDLYWAARGVGPGFFAVVLRYKLRIYDTPKCVMNNYFFPIEKMEEAVAEFLKLAPASANRSELLGSFGNFSPAGTPESEKRWHWIGIVISFGATQEEAIAAASVFNENEYIQLNALQTTYNQELTYLDLYKQLGTDDYSEFRTSEIALFTEQPGKVLRAIADKLQNNPVDSRSFGFSVLACNPTVKGLCSYTFSAENYVSWYMIATDDEGRKKNEKITREILANVKPFSKGYYMNEIDLNLFPELAEACFSPENWQRLQTLRQNYDPKGRFVGYANGTP